MMLMQAGQLGLYRKDSIWTSEIPPDMVAGATMWLDFTDTSRLFAGDHLDGGNVSTSGDPVLTVENKIDPGYGLLSVGSSPCEYEASITPSGKGAAVFNNELAKYIYYDMRASGHVSVDLSTLTSAASKLTVAAVMVAGSTPFNGLDMNGGDVIFGDNEVSALFVTEDGGAIYARASNQVSWPDQAVEQAMPRNTWVVLTASHQSGTLRLRVNGGSWNSMASGSTDFSGLHQGQVLNTRGGGAGSEIAIAHIVTANTAQTDAAISAVEHWLALDVGITPWW